MIVSMLKGNVRLYWLYILVESEGRNGMNSGGGSSGSFPEERREQGGGLNREETGVSDW